MSDIYNDMFGNLEGFLKFFEVEANNSRENREAILRTPKLCYLYCKYVEDRPEVYLWMGDSIYKRIFDQWKAAIAVGEVLF